MLCYDRKPEDLRYTKSKSFVVKVLVSLWILETISKQASDYPKSLETGEFRMYACNILP